MSRIPCGKTMGHGECCSTGYLCDSCTELNDLRTRLAAAEARAVAVEAAERDAYEQKGELHRTYSAEIDRLTARIKELEGEAGPRLEAERKLGVAREALGKMLPLLKLAKMAVRRDASLNAVWLSGDGPQAKALEEVHDFVTSALASIAAPTPLRAPDGQEVKP